ncbi:uncharacterized protein LOC108824673 [Raphanus sativus]|uniref:Uncharacterized protein LOC108824673 n=1 Tax=Raphanus sativus TaxID=3726 RepID=A0A6J0L094_RAPSA|nr:uncharacterized protein LOC108824673 [Raphanus sativus]
MERTKLPLKKRLSWNGSSMEFMVNDYMKEKGTRGRFGNSLKVLQCLGCKGFGHVQAECTNLQKRKKKIVTKSDSNDGKVLKNIVAFTTFVLGSKTKSAAGYASASVSGSSCEVMMMLAVSDDDDGKFDLAGNYEKLYENWLKHVEANSELTKEKVKLEVQVAEALKYASEKKEEARQAGAQLVETQKGLRMLNGGTNQLDHLLRKTEVLATFTMKPEVKVSVEKTSNGKTAVKTATDVKNATATHSATANATATTPEKVYGLKSAAQQKFRHVCHYCGVVGHIRPRCFKLLREKNQMVQAYGVYGMRSHGHVCYSCGVQGHIRREYFKPVQRANHGGFGLRNSWSMRFDHCGDGGMGFPPYFGGYIILVFNHDVTHRRRLKT